MIQHLRSRLRLVVAATICVLVTAPALIAGSASIAGAAPPGIGSATLTVNGEGTGTNPWYFDGGAYNNLKAELQNLANFGPSGTVTKGKFTVPGSAISTALSFPGTLSPLDVFFAGLPSGGEYTGAEITALQNFNADGRALVLNANAPGFGDVTAALGFTLKPQRAFFGTDANCGWTNPGVLVPPGGPDSAPARSTVAGGQSGNPVVAGPFGTASTVTNYHTVEVFQNLPSQAIPLYNLTVSGQAPQLAVTGPIGETTSGGVNPTHVSYQSAVVSGTTVLTTAALTPSGIASVTFYHDDATISGNQIGVAQTTYPYQVNWDTTGVTDGLHAVIARVALVGGGGFDKPMDFNGIGGVTVDNLAPPVVVPPNTGNIDLDCPGANVTRGLNPNSEDVENNISGPTVAMIPKGALSANSGPIIVTSDLDSMSNAFDPDFSPTPQYGGSWDANRTFALNSFAWILDQMLPNGPPPPPPATGTYFPLANPTRVYDSRATTAIVHGETRSIQVAGVGGVPADATSIVANVTVTNTDSAGYLTVWPTGQAQPNTSTHNFDFAESFANMIVMQVGTGGSISVFPYLNSQAGTVDVIVDVVGYSRNDGSGTLLHTIDPNRILDTRTGVGLPLAPFGAGQTQNLTVRGGATGVPADADSVVLNMTVVNATQTGSYLTVWPAGQAQPNASNINNVPGVARPNLVVAHVGAGGQISIYNFSGTADVIADVVGYFNSSGPGGVITGLTPARILDTRTPSNRFTEGQVRSLIVAGVGGIPGTAKTAILKVTAVNPTATGYLTVWPAGSTTPPNVSNVNFGAGMTIPNLVITRIGTAGQINIFNAQGTTDVLVDVLGYAD